MKFYFLAPFMFLFAFCATAFGQVAEPGSVDQAVGLLPQIFSMIVGQKYLLAGAMITLVIVFVVKQYVLPKLKVGTGVLPILSAVVGMISALALGIAGGATPGQAAVALLSGPAASTLWDCVIKYFLPKPQA